MTDRLRNADVDWGRWPVEAYLAEVYRELHPSDAAVIAHHSAFYRALAPGSVERSLELGAGPNLYPLMLAAAVSREIEAVEPSAANRAYLGRQLADGPDATWAPFYALARERQPALPGTATAALARVTVRAGGAADLEEGRYGLASMHFVAESVTEDRAEFDWICGRFARSVRPGGHLVAAFMENMGRYVVGDAPPWPGIPVDSDIIREVFAPHVAQMSTTRVDFDETGPDYGYTGMVLLTARVPVRKPTSPTSGGR
jgi:hypothetical protein